MSQLELRNIALTADRPLVHGVSLTLRAGRVLALVGGSGSGKSLTLRRRAGRIARRGAANCRASGA
ncbi:nickel ABC transporter, ATP-binding protein [Atlantibacter hermannii]|nr:nickel ABC transporter, ATP-binding protein [Atlantibacter hermannii]